MVVQGDNNVKMNDLDALLAEVEDTVSGGGGGDRSTSARETQQHYSSTTSYRNTYSDRSYTSSSSKVDDEWHKESDDSTYGRGGRSSATSSGRSIDPLDDLLSLTEDADEDSPQSRGRGSGGSSYSKPSYSSSSYSACPVNSMVTIAGSRGVGGDGEGGGRRGGSTQILLGGSNCKLGEHASKFGNIVNNRLLCLKCMCEVVRFADYHWADDVDYMFFRNYWPEVPNALGPKLKPRKGYAAYCCQCSWTSVRDIVEVDRDLKWCQQVNK